MPGSLHKQYTSVDWLAYQRANLTTLTMLERIQELLYALDGKIATSEAAFDTFLSVISRLSK